MGCSGQSAAKHLEVVSEKASQHVISLFLRIPSMAAKVETEMNKAKLDVENQLVPKGADVVRHLSLPDKGKSLEWIISQMEIMDNELSGHSNWKNGKISGAVYRMYLFYTDSSYLRPDCIHVLRRWR